MARITKAAALAILLPTRSSIRRKFIKQQFERGSILAERMNEYRIPIRNDARSDVCVAGVNFDTIHISTWDPKNPDTVSQHAAWYDLNKACPRGMKIRLQLQLQTRNPDGLWAHRGKRGQKDVYAGGGSANRVAANFVCIGSRRNTWRGELDADMLGRMDPPGKQRSKSEDLNCGIM